MDSLMEGVQEVDVAETQLLIIKNHGEPIMQIAFMRFGPGVLLGS